MGIEKDIQKMIDEMNEKQRIESGKEYNLGMFINDLKKYKDDYKINSVEFEDGTKPVEFDSWRGSYCELSLTFTSDESYRIFPMTMYQKAFNANGSMFFGYKGGEFVMDLDTPIHKANYGECGYEKIIGVKKENDKLIICVRNDEED